MQLMAKHTKKSQNKVIMYSPDPYYNAYLLEVGDGRWKEKRKGAWGPGIKPKTSSVPDERE